MEDETYFGKIREKRREDKIGRRRERLNKVRWGIVIEKVISMLG